MSNKLADNNREDTLHNRIDRAVPKQDRPEYYYSVFNLSGKRIGKYISDRSLPRKGTYKDKPEILKEIRLEYAEAESYEFLKME